MRDSLESTDPRMIRGLIDLVHADHGGSPDLKLMQRLVSRYRDDLPASLDDGDRVLRVEDLLNHDVHLGEYENPAVLAFVAIFDPYCSTAVAAAARLAPQTAARPKLLAVVALVNQQSRHREVRAVTAVLIDLGPTTDALSLLRTMAEDAVRTDRAVADAALCSYLNQLGSGGLVPDDPVGDVVGFAHRLSLAPTLLVRIFQAILESGKVALKTRVAVVRGLDRLSRPVRLSLTTHVARLPPGAENDYLKLVLARTIDEAAGSRAGRTEEQARGPWSPDWVTRRDGTAQRPPMQSLGDVLRRHRHRHGRPPAPR